MIAEPKMPLYNLSACNIIYIGRHQKASPAKVSRKIPSLSEKISSPTRDFSKKILGKE